MLASKISQVMGYLLKGGGFMAKRKAKTKAVPKRKREVEKTLISSVAELPNVNSGTKMLEATIDDKIWQIEVRMLSHYEWMAIEHKYPKPHPPSSGATGVIVYNTDEPTYKASVEKREADVQLHRIVASVVAEFPVADIEGQMEYMRQTFTHAFLFRLFLALSQLYVQDKVEIVEARFQPKRQVEAEGAGANGLDA